MNKERKNKTQIYFCTVRNKEKAESAEGKGKTARLAFVT